jgi:hypothetical protein
VVAAVVCLLAAGGATAGVLVKQHNDDVAQAKAEKAARAAAAREEAERMRRERERRQALHDLEVEIRKESVKELRRSITKHAANLVVEGLLDGPILRTECDPTGGGNIDDTAAHTGNFSCMAVTEIDGDGTMSGYNYDGSINYDSGRYGWQLAN